MDLARNAGQRGRRPRSPSGKANGEGKDMMRRALRVCVCCALVAGLLPAVASAAKSQDRDTHVQLLAINDLHGHLAPNTPGTIQVGCCNPVMSSSGVQNGWTQKTVPAGGIAYLA